MVGLVVGAIGMALAADLPHTFIWILGAYVAINLCYSLGLKQVTVLGLFLVTSGFVLRLLAGGFVVPTVELSPWIIIATGTIALLLTAGKRRGDVARENYTEEKRQTNAEYNLQYLDAVLAGLMGATLVVYLLFCVSDYATIRYGKFILVTAVPVAMGLLRYLQLVIVYKHGDTPTDLLLQDKGLMAIVLIFIFMFGVLIYTSPLRH
jgi:4-hydroxybenzoate polyprenyltransferase